MSDGIEPNVRPWMPMWQRDLGDHPSALAWQPDGATVAAASLAGEAVVFEAATGADANAPVHHPGDLAWSPDGFTLAMAMADGTVSAAENPIDLD